VNPEIQECVGLIFLYWH